MPVTIAMADSHQLVAEALADLTQQVNRYEVLSVASDGRQLLRLLRQGSVIPDIALVGPGTPEMDGAETVAALRDQFPTVRVLALAVTDDDDQIPRMLCNGARGFLLKGCRSYELRQALDEVMNKGYHYSELLTSQLMRQLQPAGSSTLKQAYNLNKREYAFLRMACSELTYNQIADRMCVSPRTVDGYREVVFQKMSVRSRVGMVIKAMQKGLVAL